MTQKAILCALDELFGEKTIEATDHNRHLHSTSIQVSCDFFHLSSPFKILSLH
jgi:hypothetical protein